MKGVKEFGKLLAMLESKRAITSEEEAALDKMRAEKTNFDFIRAAREPGYQEMKLEEMHSNCNNPKRLRHGKLSRLLQEKKNKDRLDLMGEMLLIDFELWFEEGESVPPGGVWNAAVLLRKMKLLEMERRLLEAWAKHITYKDSGRYKSLHERLNKMQQKASGS